MGILWSCLSVIFICCWSVVHPNVPGPKDSDRRVFWYKLGYAGCCLVAPELFLVYAIEQWFDCRHVSKVVKGLLETEDADGKRKYEVG